MTDQVLAEFERFELGEKIGQGGQGITYKALDRKTGKPVVIKELRVEHIDDWKSVELFEREGEALEALDHPAIPAYVDHFHIDSEDSSRLFLVQEFVDGHDLASAIEDGLRMTEAQVIDFIAELLEILRYIHGLEPPIIHRDIKPANILRRDDGSLALVDFGAARTVLKGTTGGSTVVGTTGYMPLEQLMGRALPATDLYAVGATAIHLLSHKHPADIDVLDMKLKFHDDISVSPGLEAFLDQLVEPHVEDRYQSAEEALAALGELDRRALEAQPKPAASRNPAPLEHAPNQGGAKIDGFLGRAVASMAKKAETHAEQKLAWAQGFFDGDSYERPLGSHWTDIERDGARVLHREPMGFKGALSSFVVALGLYAFLSIFFVTMLFGEPASGSETFGFFVLGLFGLVGLLIVYQGAQKAWGIEEFELRPDTIIHRKQLFNREKTQMIMVDDVEDIDIGWRTSSSSSNGRTSTKTYYFFVIDTRFKEHKFGEEMSKEEKLWAASAIREHVAAHKADLS